MCVWPQRRPVSLSTGAGGHGHSRHKGQCWYIVVGMYYMLSDGGGRLRDALVV